jgi:hypothetical protein
MTVLLDAAGRRRSPVTMPRVRGVLGWPRQEGSEGTRDQANSGLSRVLSGSPTRMVPIIERQGANSHTDATGLPSSDTIPSGPDTVRGGTRRPTARPAARSRQQTSANAPIGGGSFPRHSPPAGWAVFPGDLPQPRQRVDLAPGTVPPRRRTRTRLAPTTATRRHCSMARSNTFRSRTRGRVLAADGEPLPGVHAVGWISAAPPGSSAPTSATPRKRSAASQKDLASGALSAPEIPDREQIDSLLTSTCRTSSRSRAGERSTRTGSAGARKRSDRA